MNVSMGKSVIIAFIWGELRKLSTRMFTSYEANDCFIILNLLCCAEDKKVISCIENTITELA